VFNCQKCGAEFVARHKRKYCVQHSTTWRDAECAQCRKTYKTKKNNSRFCSRKCKSDSMRVFNGNTAYCIVCGKQFVMNRRKVCCGRECGFIHHKKLLGEIAWIREQSRRAKQTPKEFPECRICGGPVKGNPCSRYCSHKCRLKKWARYNRRRWNKESKWIETCCQKCGVAFSVRVNPSKRRTRYYCSQRCSTNSTQVQKSHTRRVAYRLGDRITLQDVASLSLGLCGICGDVVDMSLHGWDQRGPTIDHIVPLSRGGTHTLGNVQLAHRACNTRKGAKTEITPKIIRAVA